MIHKTVSLIDVSMTYPGVYVPYLQVLREHGVHVLTVRDVLSFAVDEHIGARVDLEDVAMEALKYQMATGGHQNEA